MLREGSRLMLLGEGTRAAHRELEQKLRPFVARRVPAPDVDDVLQDVFVRLHQSLSQLRDEDRFGPWLYRVARSAISERLRQRDRHPLSREEAVEVPDHEAEPESEPSGANELANYVVSLITQLPSPYREALTLTELEGVTQAAAAEMLGITLSAMKSRVQRGREKLRELIDACCKIDLDVRQRVIDCEPRDPNFCRCR
jgi:RNA polymerase sigma-70 factor (ECF subfamily)